MAIRQLARQRRPWRSGEASSGAFFGSAGAVAVRLLSFDAELSGYLLRHELSVARAELSTVRNGRYCLPVLAARLVERRKIQPKLFVHELATISPSPYRASARATLAPRNLSGRDFPIEPVSGVTTACSLPGGVDGAANRADSVEPSGNDASGVCWFAELVVVVRAR